MSVTITDTYIELLIVPSWLRSILNAASVEFQTLNLNELSKVISPEDMTFYKEGNRKTKDYILYGISDDIETVAKFLYGPQAALDSKCIVNGFKTTMTASNTILIELYADTNNDSLSKVLLDVLVPIYGIESVASDTLLFVAYVRAKNN